MPITIRPSDLFCNLGYTPERSWGKVIRNKQDLDLSKPGATAVQGRLVRFDEPVQLSKREYLVSYVTVDKRLNVDKYHVIVATLNDACTDIQVVMCSMVGTSLQAIMTSNYVYESKDYCRFLETREKWKMWSPFLESQFQASYSKRVAAFLIWKYEQTGDNSDFVTRTGYLPEQLWVVGDGLTIQLVTTNKNEADILANKLNEGCPQANYGPRTLRHHIDLVYQQGVISATDDGEEAWDKSIELQ